MILQRLKEFWEAQPETVSAGYQKAFLTKKIVLDATGKLINVESLSGETRGKRHGKSIAVPREQPGRTVGVRPRLVQDNANYALGIVGPEDNPQKVAERNSAYRRQLHEAALATKEPSLTAIENFLGSLDPEAFSAKYGINTKLDDFLFEVDGVVPTDLQSLKTYWAADSSGTEGFCLVDGIETSVVERMPVAIKGVPGGQSSGTMLVSVNNPSGESYGHEAAYNSPIGKATAESICNGLNLLLSSRSHSLRVGDTVYVFWSRSNSEFDFASFLSDPDPENVAQLIGSYRQGEKPLLIEARDYFVLGLTANASRIVVRDYHETTLPAVQRNLAKWFANLELIGDDGKPLHPFGIFRLAASLYRDAKDIPKSVPISLVKSALEGTALPRNLLALAIRRNVAMQGPFQEFNGKRSISYARVALIRACLSGIRPQEETQLTSLNQEHPESAYQCGRLLSVLESIQKLAIPGLNATLVDRNYGSASASPGSIFGGLIKDATIAHLPKLRKNSPGAYAALDERLRNVLEHVGTSFPKTLDYEKQGLFALGYYHQRAHDIAEARSRSAQNKADAFAKLAELDTPSDATEEN